MNNLLLLWTKRNLTILVTPISKFPYYSVSFYFIRFIIPNKFEAFAIYFFPIFFWNNTSKIVGSFSGLIMNKDKTEGLWIGKLKHCKDKVGGNKWTDKQVKTLEIYFGLSHLS
jgi:hypothetical protein